MADLDDHREITRCFWAGEECLCPRHPESRLAGKFVHTTYADHIHFDCPRGHDLVIPQRPRQVEFNTPQIEGLIASLQRGDKVLCYRCQSSFIIDRKQPPDSTETRYFFTCVRCLSYGLWEGSLESASSA